MDCLWAYTVSHGTWILSWAQVRECPGQVANPLQGTITLIHTLQKI